jgi:hypothetical protein
MDIGAANDQCGSGVEDTANTNDPAGLVFVRLLQECGFPAQLETGPGPTIGDIAITFGEKS